ncbi:Periplakin [Frankliniella fusca]|uniref:Periplakin n=1 Tax=Frankliniella fusca TaxID=407009 RepID=A0AAE1LMB3_9NEOP|nr:Periplakin [Frankliniella fusca]
MVSQNNIIKRIQTGLPDDKRVKKGKVVKKKKPRTITSCNVNIKELALLMPDRANKLEISDSMAKTYSQRCQARDNGASITEILRDFPHLKSYNGEMISAEYQRIMCPDSRDMCPEMAKYIPKILEKWDDKSLVLNHTIDTLRAFFILA